MQLFWQYTQAPKSTNDKSTNTVSQTSESTAKKPGLVENSIIDVFEMQHPITSAVKANLNKDSKQPITDEAARSLALAYINSKQEGEEAEINESLQEISDDFLNVKYTMYDSGDIKIDASVTANDYTKNMRRAIRPLLKIKEYELDTVAKAVKDSDETAFATLNDDIALYTTTINNLLAVAVNQDLAVPHLALINAYSKLVASLELILKSKNDIMLAYPGLKLFLEADREIYSAYDALKLYVELHDKKQTGNR